MAPVAPIAQKVTGARHPWHPSLRGPCLMIDCFDWNENVLIFVTVLYYRACQAWTPSYLSNPLTVQMFYWSFQCVFISRKEKQRERDVKSYLIGLDFQHSSPYSYPFRPLAHLTLWHMSSNWTSISMCPLINFPVVFWRIFQFLLDDQMFKFIDF